MAQSIELNKTEKLVMTEVYMEATKKGGNCLIRPIDLLSSIPYSVELRSEELDEILQSLVYDEYIELVQT